MQGLKSILMSFLKKNKDVNNPKFALNKEFYEGVYILDNQVKNKKKTLSSMCLTNKSFKEIVEKSKKVNKSNCSNAEKAEQISLFDSFFIK